MAKAAAKANSTLALIRKAFTFMDSNMFLALYKSLVRPHLEYCIQAWSPYLRKDIDTLEKVQRRATKLVPDLRDLPYEHRLLMLDLPTLEARRVRGDMLETYKILHGFENIDPTKFFQLATDHGNIATRGHSFKLQKTRHRTSKRGIFFDARIIDKWNSLAENVVCSPCINTFKIRYDNFERDAQRRGTPMSNAP